MSKHHARAARREREAAAALGSKRVHRSRYESAPDIQPVTLPSGHTLSIEVKTRARLPVLLTSALEQAAGYNPEAIPCAVLSEKGGVALLVLPLKAFAAIVGVSPANEVQHEESR